MIMQEKSLFKPTKRVNVKKTASDLILTCQNDSELNKAKFTDFYKDKSTNSFTLSQVNSSIGDYAFPKASSLVDNSNTLN